VHRLANDTVTRNRCSCEFSATGVSFRRAEQNFRRNFRGLASEKVGDGEIVGQPMRLTDNIYSASILARLPQGYGAGQIMPLDQRLCLGLGVSLAPISEIGAVGGLDRFGAADGGAVELVRRKRRTGHQTPWSVDCAVDFNARFYWVFEGANTVGRC